MPLYRVVCDGVDILDYSSKDLVLLAPDLELEVNTAGSFEFVMPPYHKYYGIVKLFESTIEVYEDGNCIWFGRAVEEKTDFYKQKKIYCEGPLSFFNDTIQRPAEFDAILLEQFFRDTIARHTQQVDNPNRRFNVGEFQMDSTAVYRKLDYESSYDVLTSMCLDTNGGYMFFRRENGINYIDWYKEMPYTCNQSIQFGLNLLNYSSSFDGSDFATCVLPLGEKISDSDSYLNISEINDGSDILKSDAVDTYGSIIKVQRWNDIEDPSELKTEAQKWLEDTQFNASSIECSAADLHSKDGNYELFRVGQIVHCVSNPHLVDKDFPLSKMSLKLDSAVKIITLGSIKRKTLTKIYKKASEAISDYPEYQDYPVDIYDPSVLTDEHGDEWELVWPEDGGPVTAERMPTHITVAREPNKTNYSPGESLDFTGLLVNIWTKDKNGNDSIWTRPPKYIDGHAPFGELSFSTNRAPKISEFSVMVTWRYKGKEYHTTVEMTTEERQGSRVSPLDTSPWIQPIITGSYALIRFKLEDGKRSVQYIEHFKPSSDVQYAIYAADGYCAVIAASSHSFPIERSLTIEYYNEDPPRRTVREYTSHSVDSYTYNGKTVFIYKYSGLYSGTPLVDANPQSNASSGGNLLEPEAARHVAWTMIYGEIVNS